MGGEDDSCHGNPWRVSACLAVLWVTAEVLQTADELLLFNMFSIWLLKRIKSVVCDELRGLLS